MESLEMENQHKLLLDQGWELDMFSTMLSRKHSFHKVVGKRRYVKPRNRKESAWR